MTFGCQSKQVRLGYFCLCGAFRQRGHMRRGAVSLGHTVDRAKINYH